MFYLLDQQLPERGMHSEGAVIRVVCLLPSAGCIDGVSRRFIAKFEPYMTLNWGFENSLE